jgi:hypothetical protein
MCSASRGRVSAKRLNIGVPKKARFSASKQSLDGIIRIYFEATRIKPFGHITVQHNV